MSAMTSRVRRWTLPLAMLLAVAPAATARERPHTAAGCPSAVCGGAEDAPLVVHVRIANQSRLTPADVARVLDVAGRIWLPYRITLEPGAGDGAVTVVVTDGPTATTADSGGATVLGTTLFSEGHATPYIRLSVGAAEAAADACHGDGLPFAERPGAARSAILQRMLGVALAHELAHYLLDTAQHSAGGLLRADIRVTELVRPAAVHYPLTLDQQHRLCAARKRQ